VTRRHASARHGDPDHGACLTIYDPRFFESTPKSPALVGSVPPRAQRYRADDGSPDPPRADSIHRSSSMSSRKAVALPSRWTETIPCHRANRVAWFKFKRPAGYAPDLISHGKVAAPSGILIGDRPSSDAGDGDREASRDRQDDRGVKDSGERGIPDREIDPLSSSLRRANILISAVSGKRATIFFLSSCFFAAGWVLQLALDNFYPVRSSGLAELLTTGNRSTVLLGFLTFIFGMGSFFVEACGFLIIRHHREPRSPGRTTLPRSHTPVRHHP
jgi:hypothetical protein